MGNTSISAKIAGSAFLRYGTAMIAGLLASAICSQLSRVIGNAGCYVPLMFATAFSAWYCGIGPSLMVMGLAVLGEFLGFIPKVHRFAVPTTADLVAMIMFLVVSVILILMGRFRLGENLALLRAQGELEQRVTERTADLDTVNRNLRELSARLMQLQDDERRRIARELHDSVGQTLAALAMNLSVVRNDVERLANMAVALNDSESLVRDMSKEVRTISHLLHPPLLDEAGLASALSWYVNGFAQRSKIKVDLDLPEDFSRLPGEMETAIFRVVQECLTNIHRHSASPVAKIHVHRDDNEVRVEIEDKGKGIPAEKKEEMASNGMPGVGIRGMRERIRQLGGSLDIASSPSGTNVIVRLPIAESSTRREPVEAMVDPAAA